MSIQEQAVCTFREHQVGLYTPTVLLRRLGICLSKRIERREDLLRLTEEEARKAINLIPKLQSPLLPASTIAKTLV